MIKNLRKLSKMKLLKYQIFGILCTCTPNCSQNNEFRVSIFNNLHIKQFWFCNSSIIKGSIEPQQFRPFVSIFWQHSPNISKHSVEIVAIYTRYDCDYNCDSIVKRTRNISQSKFGHCHLDWCWIRELLLYTFPLMWWTFLNVLIVNSDLLGTSYL